MKWLKFFLPAVLCVAYIYLLNSKLGDIPPLGKLISPFTGFWQNNESASQSSLSVNCPALKEPVSIRMDDNLVPHIFARSNHDLYFAQGYIHAKYRLWQMEFQTHAAAGRVAEIIGGVALSYDLQQRRFGMGYAAEKAEAMMMADPLMKEALDAYTSGVNWYIENLEQADLPIEYKVLDYKPERWTPLKCALLLKYMTYELAGRSNDLPVTKILNTYGKSAIDSLFSGKPYLIDPIIPVGTKWDFVPLPLPPIPADWVDEVPLPEINDAPHPDNGSNNWAVHGNKTASGFPILCGDPHLGLNLPSYWYQMQLVNDECNVTGVSLPGVPTIIIGFNEKIAWSETNVDADVLDWYSVKFKDQSYREYMFNGKWTPAVTRVEEVKVRGGEMIIDTVIYTHHGPVVTLNSKAALQEDFPNGFAMRWLGHDASVELKCFLLLNRASDYTSFVDALSYFSCPAQNFVYADANNNIAIWVNGKFPLKWKEQGKFLMDGSRLENDWQGWLPHQHVPHVLNPERDFVSSANQPSTDSTYPYYLNWSMDAPKRAHRINEVLASGNDFSMKEMSALQFDNKNMTADYVLPEMMASINESALDSYQLKQLIKLRTWNRMASVTSIEQTLFEAWWRKLNYEIWDDELGQTGLQYPDIDIAMKTVKLGINKSWIDNKNTPEKETLTMLINRSYAAALKSLINDFGEDPAQWQWAIVKKTHINHLLRIPALSRSMVITPGNSGIVNATGTNHGPSWRMIVELGPQLKAYGIYPGGQSGNPGSPFYENMIDPWSKGKQMELVIMQNAEQSGTRIMSTFTLKN